MKPKGKKQEELNQLKKDLADARNMIVAKFQGMTVAQDTDLRSKIRATNSQYRVVKNTLARRALQGSGLETLQPLLEGPNAWAVHRTDQVAAAKVLSDFAKDHEALKIRGGSMEGRLLTVQEIRALAKLPSREVLLSQVLAGMQGPLAGFAGALTALLRSFATVVDGYAKKRAETEGA